MSNESIVPSQPIEVSATEVRRREQETRSIFLALLSSNIFGLFLGGLYEYLSLRGVVNTPLARLFLVGVWGLGILLCWIIVWAAHVRRKKSAVFLGAGILATLLITMDIWATRTAAQGASTATRSFGIVPGQAWLSPSFHKGMYWVVFQPIKSITPVHVLALYTITNTKATPVMISNLSLEMLGVHDSWWPLTNLPTYDPLWAADLNHPTKVAAIFLPEGFLKENVRNVEIEPGRSVQGWMICQIHVSGTHHSNRIVVNASICVEVISWKNMWDEEKDGDVRRRGRS